MTPVIPCSTSRIALVPGTPFTLNKTNAPTKCSLSRKSAKHAQRLAVLPFPASIKSLSNYKTHHHALAHRSTVHSVTVSATGTDIAVGEPESPATSEEEPVTSEEDSNKASEIPAETAPTQAKRARPGRKSEMPPVKNEDLVPGAMFTGKVRSIQPFGAFIDFGAFTDGLVHVSRLSDSYVKDVGNVVSVGQEVKVRLLEANTETGRISLSMRDDDDNDGNSSKPQQQRKDYSASTGGGDKPRPGRRNTQRSGQKRDEKTAKFVIGQQLDGTVKNLTRSGAFLTLPEGEEGFLPASEEVSEGFGNLMGGSQLVMGQEVSVRVLRINRGQFTLTMKKEEDNQKEDKNFTQGVIHAATNPFLVAFRKNKDIAEFLDDREKLQKDAEISEEKELEQEEIVASSEVAVEANDGEKELEQEEIVASSEVAVEANVGEKDLEQEETVASSEVESIESSSSEEVESAVQAAADDEPIEEPEKIDATVNEIVSADQKVEEPSIEVVESDGNSDSSAEAPVDESVVEGNVEEQIEAAATPVDNEVATEAADESGSFVSSDGVESGESSDLSQIETEAADNQTIEEVPKKVEDNETISASLVESEKEDPAPEGNGLNSNPPPKETTTAATISPALVKQLREETGAGMMDCKKALSETGGDIIKAMEFLRTKGLASAEKKASRTTAEGRIGSYIHDSRIGILIEVNCETDFVSRGEIFKELVDDLAMQVAACPQVQVVATEDVAEAVVSKEREIEMQKEDLLSKPEQIRAKIVEGRIKKRLDELALLEQPYIKNDKVLVKDWIKQTIATIGENMKVKRFVRYNLGEGLQKKSQDFAAEVAAQTAAKSAPAPPKDQPAAVTEEKEAVQKPPAAAVSAALVKQLREETGAGMMDCKKALAETGGDLEKAQDYLRKKGLSSADKKSSRLAAEGRIGSYIHDSRIGVLIEVNCETDFVGRGEIFKELVDDLAMQVVACPQVQFVSTEDVPKSIVEKEKELEMQREDLQSKPENIREKIVEGRISKRLGELALLEQPFIKDDKLLVKDLVKQTVASLGENIKVRRFVRFTLGEDTD
ncbi:unnamed protein product [Linum trigynum]|uniref:Elongation factor Ts, mitochondrial n=1 Tax=Linum trigynum TaxID=586398 RepID=A0AAV2GYJ3_9ROSI